jgi:hypothetical protein
VTGLAEVEEDLVPGWLLFCEGGVCVAALWARKAINRLARKGRVVGMAM